MLSMSISRKFVINELRRLEFRFYPDSEADKQAMKCITEAVRLLEKQQAGETKPTSLLQRILAPGKKR
jgi:hypothetical protein